ncbi:hypothetical protein [Paludibaculum fermentans]|uniref:Uncharacterized protein n=1 Tax=Paludibaculum fermentans TaxID=1473598 RepID=A0A7S7NNN6_PALFE|nr:hypothetical protein [Paludibaculum fermentans]QOY86941.1 hypothetical protein IRI77_29830 [Paludibaculum fermentans]
MIHTEKQLDFTTGQVNVIWQSVEAPTALLNHAELCHSIFGPSRVGVPQMNAWIQSDGRLLNKPTHFENREGRF